LFSGRNFAELVEAVDSINEDTRSETDPPGEAGLICRGR